MHLRGSANHVEIHSSDKGTRKRKSPIGEYDKTILCKDCDTKFEVFDDYAKKLFLDNFSSFKKIHRNNELVGWEVGEYDFLKLRNFLLSVLWRASICKRPYFNRINLGPFEKKVKEEIAKGHFEKPDRFEFLLTRFLPDRIPDFEQTMSNPDSLKVLHVNFCRIHFSGYSAWIKIDKRPMPKQFEALVVSEISPMRIMARTFGDSKERNLIIESSKFQT